MDAREARLTVFTAFLAFVGSVGGVYLGDVLKQEGIRRERLLTQRHLLIQQRMELIEKTAIVITKAQLAKSFDEQIQFKRSDAAFKQKEVEENPEKGRRLLPEILASLDEADKIERELIILTAEVTSVQLLGELLFGPKTTEEIAKANQQPWWVHFPEHRRNWLKAMRDEIQL